MPIDVANLSYVADHYSVLDLKMDNLSQNSKQTLESHEL